jgi:hypothetical protein
MVCLEHLKSDEGLAFYGVLPVASNLFKAVHSGE